MNENYYRMTSIILIASLFTILLFHEFRMHRKPLTYEFYYHNNRGHKFWFVKINYRYNLCILTLYIVFTTDKIFYSRNIKKSQVLCIGNILN